MKIQIFLGTGGVGKTSIAAATALGSALRGEKALVLTIDPAQRLRTALRLDSGQWQQQVPVESAADGQLWAALLETRSTLDRAVQSYATSPQQVETILKHPIYEVLISSLAGMQELMAIERLDQALRDDFERIVVDTAPSRHALEFLDKPEQFGQLVSFPLVQLVGRTYKWFEGSRLSRWGRQSVDLYSKVEELLGATLVRQVLDFYSIFRSIAEGYARRAAKTARRLRDPKTTSFHIVTTPYKARRDVEYFWKELQTRKFPIEGLVINRVWPATQGDLPGDAPALATRALDWYRSVSADHQRISAEVFAQFSAQIPSHRQIPELSRDADGLEALHQISRSLEV
ncbi:MAG: ArsA family ATPase [Acidobacteriota bacterium]